MVHQKKGFLRHARRNRSEIPPFTEICVCMRFELADCNSCSCVDDPVDLVAFLNFLLKNS